MQITEADKRAEAAGLPQEQTLDYLYRIKSAFLALFLAHNMSVVGTKIPPLVKARTDTQTLLRWSDLKDQVSRSGIIRDLKIYSELQGTPD